MTKDELTISKSANFSSDENSNLYKIDLQNDELLAGKNLFLVFESDNPEFTVSILEDENAYTSRVNSIMDLSTFSGNLVMAMSDTFFNSRLNYFKESGSLKFMVVNKSQSGNLDYKITI